jgi:hypothetical protein
VDGVERGEFGEAFSLSAVKQPSSGSFDLAFATGKLRQAELRVCPTPEKGNSDGT